MESKIGRRLSSLEAELLPAGEPVGSGVLARVGRLEEILEGAPGNSELGLARRLENLEVLVFGAEGAEGTAEAEPQEEFEDLGPELGEPLKEPSGPPPKRLKPSPVPAPAQPPSRPTRPRRGAPAVQHPGHVDLQAYARSFGLNDDAIRTLHELPPESLAYVQQNFEPREGTKNISALFISFARKSHFSRTGQQLGRQSAQERAQGLLDEFAQRWELNSDAVAWLQMIDDQLALEEVVASFHPSPGTTNISAKLIGFAKSVYWRNTGKQLMDPRQWHYG
ncbi:unnamed protein product [Symbiodinium sp. CCMP2592]|nr:unnamed protein product [Symbiodinium sp. CCMP2592]